VVNGDQGFPQAIGIAREIELARAKLLLGRVFFTRTGIHFARKRYA
jgi:hypothetical protein